MITVKVVGARELADLFKRAPNEAKKILKQTIAKAGFLVESISAQEAPADTGTLRKSIETDLSGLEDFRAEITPTADYAEFVHEGHGEIRPKIANVLAVRASRVSPRARAKFGRKGGAGWIIFGKRVKPQPANRFMNRGLVKSTPRIRRMFDRAGKDIVKKLTLKK